ncbi:hypothetical protein BGZ83_003112 [Gryganskiella cystojenkinii]|nr:hypothetical protein BGZ83_003112 [Gryganskiella cystojenkinii]
MARLCKQVQRKQQKQQLQQEQKLIQLASSVTASSRSRNTSNQQHPSDSRSSGDSIVLALQCMNQYELRRACHDWEAIIVHIDPDCAALQRSVSLHYNSYHLWAAIKAAIWGGILVAVAGRQTRIVNNSRWPTSKLAQACVLAIGALFTASCLTKTLEFMKEIPRGYSVVKIRNMDHQGIVDHLFLIRRDFTLKNDPRVVPMYLLSGLGIGTILVGARIAFKIRKMQ